MKRIKWILIMTILIMLPSSYVDAASIRLRSSSSSVTQGNKVTVTATISDGMAIFFTEGKLVCTGAGVNKETSLSFENMDNNVKQHSFSLSITPTQTGKVTCKTVGAKYTGGSSGNWTNIENKSLTINVVKPREKSTNNNLKSLSVEGYTLSPEFNQDTLEYTVELEASVEKIMVNAEKADSYASISGGGEIAVSEGDNRIEIKVTSETGKEKVYVINAVVKDSNPITTTVENKKLTVVKKASSLTKPDLFEETKIKINEMEIPAFYNETTGTTLVGLRDESGKIELYIYDQDKNSYQKYLTLIGTEFHLIQKEAKGIPEGYQKVTKKIDDIEYTAYQKDKSDFLLLYGTILENGSEGWYSYDTKEKTLQRYNKDIVESITKEYQDIQDTDHKVIIGLAVLSSVLALTTMILALRKPRVKKVNNKEKKEEVSEDKKSKEKKGNQKKNNGKEKEENSSNE